jgi:tetratricopeptide (TPR) repeat protein
MAFNNLGFRLLHIGQVEQAKLYIQHAVEKDPGAYPLGNLAHVYAIEGKHAEAVALCEIAKEYAFSSRTQAFLEYCLFCIYLIADKKAEALLHFKEALLKDKKLTTNYYNRNVNIVKWKDDKDILAVSVSVNGVKVPKRSNELTDDFFFFSELAPISTAPNLPGAPLDGSIHAWSPN